MNTFFSRHCLILCVIIAVSWANAPAKSRICLGNELICQQDTLKSKPKPKESTGAVYVLVEKMPVFGVQVVEKPHEKPNKKQIKNAQTNLDPFQKYINDNKVYPESAKANKIQGTVYVAFVVDEQGNVESARVVRGVDPALDAEAVRVILSSPQWKHGSTNGKPVRVQMVTKVEFKL